MVPHMAGCNGAELSHESFHLTAVSDFLLPLNSFLLTPRT